MLNKQAESYWPGPCEVCGKEFTTHAAVHAESVWACPEHPWCADCAFPHVAAVCPRDGERVRDQPSAEAAANEVRRDLAALGILVPSVPIELIATFSGNKLGEAHTIFNDRCRPQHTVRVLSGLGPTRFRLVAAHELTHCLLNTKPRGRLDLQVEEGVCELVAVVWLCSTDRSDTERHLRQTWRNADPLYGEGLRSAVRAARRAGVPAVVKTVIEEGRLP